MLNGTSDRDTPAGEDDTPCPRLQAALFTFTSHHTSSARALFDACTAKLNSAYLRDGFGDIGDSGRANGGGEFLQLNYIAEEKVPIARHGYLVKVFLRAGMMTWLSDKSLQLGVATVHADWISPDVNTGC